MQISNMNWQQVEEYLARDDPAILPLGSTEQHAYLSLCVDNILAERVAIEAAEPLGIPVFPVLNYGLTPYFMAYPGTVSLRIETYFHVVRDILDSLAQHGFRRIVLVNGHGGNIPVQGLLGEWMADHPGRLVRLHNWWNAPRTLAKVYEIDPVASHASWMENFPWTRLPGIAMPDTQKPMVNAEHLRLLNPDQLRTTLGDGNYGGWYQRSDADMQAIWEVAVAETRAVIEELPT
ncbi:MAG: creatininase family protein [Chloroflexota bacterium]